MDLTRKTTFLKGWPWFKFHNLVLALDMALKFYTSAAKNLVLNLSYVGRRYRGKTGRGAFLPTQPPLPQPPPPILNRIKYIIASAHITNTEIFAFIAVLIFKTAGTGI